MKKLNKNDPESSKKRKTVTHEFLAMHPYVIDKAKYDDGKEEYCITMLFPKKVDLSKAAKGYEYSLRQICRNAAIQAFGPKENWPVNLEMPFRDGDTDKHKKGQEAFKGMNFLKAKSKKRAPQVIDRDGEPITDAEEVYSGCYCRAQVSAYAYNNSGNVGIGLSILNVQKLRDGEPIDAFVEPATDVFNKLADEDDDDRPSKKRSRDEDEDDDEPRSKKKKRRDEDEDEDDDRPKKKKRRDEDEDDDDEPKPKKAKKPKRRDEDEDEPEEDEEPEDDELIDEDDDDDLPPPPKKKKKK